MGGTISVESTPHKGSRFVVEVPIEIDRESRCEIDAKNVLLITDEENLVANVTASFRGSGIPLHAARSREEVAEYLRDTPVDTILLSGYAHDSKLHDIVHLLHEEAKDAILMDIQMPVMNGLDATRAVRRSANPLGKTIPIIAMTANAFSSDVQACLDAGMDAHVPKPLDLATLERTLRSVMNAKFSGGGDTCPPVADVKRPQ